MSEDESADDDWFESALEDDDAETAEGDRSEDDEQDPGFADAFDDGDAVGDPDDREAGGASSTGSSERGDDGQVDQREDGTAAGASSADDGSESPFGGGGSGDGESPFGGGESENSESPFGGGAGGESESPFGGSGESDGPFGGGEGEELFDDDFSSAFDSAGGEEEFDEEDFESDIPRIKLGIEGLDDMILGGVPERHLLVTIGAAGTGKTTFGLQFLQHGLQKEDPEKAVFITLEQSYEAIVATAEERGWEFREYEDQDHLAIIDLDPVEMANSLRNIRAELPELVEQFGADRLVLDSVSLLEMMYDDQAKRRTEVFDFTRSLKEAGVTTMLTSEASENNPYASRHGIIEYLTDAVIFLQYVRQETRETRLAVEIQKIRNANHSRETKPYEITGEGISVYQQANIF